MRINPVFLLGSGTDSENSGTLYTNTRGLEAQGTIDNKIDSIPFLPPHK